MRQVFVDRIFFGSLYGTDSLRHKGVLHEGSAFATGATIRSPINLIIGLYPAEGFSQMSPCSRRYFIPPGFQ
jgi:hypothetical protein